METFDSFCEHARIVNRMITMHASEPLSLVNIVTKLGPNATYRPARPCRIRWRYQRGMTIQLFPRGSVQLLGANLDDERVDNIRTMLTNILGLDLSSPILCSCTIECRIAPRLTNLLSIPSSSSVSNEYEIFPGTLIQDTSTHFHVSFFTNGKAIVTGATSLEEAYEKLKQCITRYDIH